MKIKVTKKGTTYIPDEIRNLGYEGNLEIVSNFCVLVVPKPGAKNMDIARSLEILVEDFKHRAKIIKEKGWRSKKG